MEDMAARYFTIGAMILVLCPDVSEPAGGVRKLYRLVDVLNGGGYHASIVHREPGFRCTWFRNATPVMYRTEFEAASRAPDAVLVIPEGCGPRAALMIRGVRKVIFNQNAYYTFVHYSLDPSVMDTPYRDPDTVGVITVSEDSRRYLEYVFPGLRVERIRYGVDAALFHDGTPKKPQIAFMPRKNASHAGQVINLLKFRGTCRGYSLVSVDGRSESEVAAILRESLVFLSFGYPEGFGLPPAEAMACGCVVIGYHGMGGSEYFLPEFSYPVAYGDIVAYAKTVERVLELHRADPARLAAQAARAGAFVRQTYSCATEEADLLRAWRALVP
jgi:hypothetical protein